MRPTFEDPHRSCPFTQRPVSSYYPVTGLATDPSSFHRMNAAEENLVTAS